MLRNSKRNYYSKQFEKAKGNVKNTWKIINSVIHNKQQTKINSINIDGVNVNNPKFIVDHFNHYFTNFGKNLSSTIDSSNLNFAKYLSNPNSKSIFLSPVTEEEIIDTVDNLPNKTSTGFDLISSSLIKSVIREVSSPLTFITNFSMLTGYVPDKMKIARITPIFKSGNPNLASNYRPISVLTTFSKIIERVIYKRTIEFFDKYSILSDCQYGFRAHHSTTHAIIKLIDKITTGLDMSLDTIGIFLDLSKAFDTVDHEILLSKLEYYGIRGVALDWFKSYLSNRHQFVSINGIHSTYDKISCGVPQGSILGPLLFSVYINDFNNSSDVLSFILFADDSNLFYSHNDRNVLINTINSEMEKVSVWMKANKLSLNIKK